jgi:TPR repeat protein
VEGQQQSLERSGGVRRIRIAAVAVGSAVLALYGIEEAYFYVAVLKPGIAKITAAAEAGDPTSQTLLGIVYQQGGIPRELSTSMWHLVEVPADPVKAAFWFQRAAGQNYSEAEWLLAWLIASGKWIPRNDAEVVNWMHRSADHGNAMGQWMLGKMYDDGYNGVTKDRTKAIEWYQKAAAQGQVNAIERLRAMTAR